MEESDWTRRTESSKYVTRTLRALELLTRTSLSQAELARELDIHPRTARRLLNALAAEGYATRSSATRPDFTATLKLAGLASRLTPGFDLARVASHFVAQLSAQTQHTAYLGVLGDDAVVTVLEQGYGDSAGSRYTVAPYHASALGKALLAHSPEHVARLVAGTLDRFTEHTTTEPADLLVELAQVRERGYAVDRRESDLRFEAVAAPVFDYTRNLAAAVGVAALAEELASNGIPKFAAAVVDTARSLSGALGATVAATTVDLAEGSLSGI